MAQRKKQRLRDEPLLRLWRACDSGNIPRLVKVMHEFDPDLCDLDGGVEQAIKKERFVLLRYLLDLGYPFGGNDIRHALAASSIPCLEIFREYGWKDVDMNISDGNSACNALTFSAGDPILVSYLLARGADPDLGPTSQYLNIAQGRVLTRGAGTALLAAVLCGSFESVNLLLAYGADPTIRGLMHAATRGERIPMMERVLKAGADIDEGDDLSRHGWPAYGSPLHRTIKTGKVELVRFLLERGASVTMPDWEGWTPLQIVRMECCGGRVPCLEGWHVTEIIPEIRELVFNAVFRAKVDEAMNDISRY